MSHLDPHATIDLLERIAQDSRDDATMYLFLQILKNSPIDAYAKPMNRGSGIHDVALDTKEMEYAY